MSWWLVANPTAEDYRVELWRESCDGTQTDFHHDTVGAQTTGSTQSYSLTGHLQAGYRYYWRVQALNPNSPGPWSEIRSFTTAYSPDRVQLDKPDDNTTVSTTPLLTWHAYPEACSYQVRMQAGGQSVYTAEVQAPQRSHLVPSQDALEPDRVHTWWVNAFYADGTDRAASETRTFTTEPAVLPLLAPPVLSFPRPDSVGLPLSLTLHWYEAPQQALGYRVQLEREADHVVLVDTAGVTALSH